METSRFQQIAVILIVGAILIGIAFYLRYQATKEEPPPPGYYTGPMLPKSQRMGMPGGLPPTGTPASTGQPASSQAPKEASSR